MGASACGGCFGFVNVNGDAPSVCHASGVLDRGAENEVKPAESVKATKTDPDSSDDEKQGESKVFSALDRVLDEWFVTGMHRAGAKKFIQNKIIKEKDGSCKRVFQWLMLRMNGKVWDHGYPLMCRAPDNIPAVRSHPVWPRAELPWLSAVESYHADILGEIMAVRNASGGSSCFQPYRDPVTENNEAQRAADGLGVEGVDRGSWNVLYLLLNHKKFEDNCARFPKTIQAIGEAFPRSYSHAFFSALTPGSHIMHHTGPSNRMLRCFLPLCGCEGVKHRVGDKIVEPKAGEAYLWDHSYDHEVWHEGPETRIILIVDIWHPDLSADEIKFLGIMQNCRLRAGRLMSEELGDSESKDPSYFALVERARSLLTDDDWWVLRAEKDPTAKPT